MNKIVNKRWYDSDPTVSLAISFIRNLSYEEQTEIAEKIIQKGKSLGIEINEARIVLNRRWYDENEYLSDAMEYLRTSKPIDQKAIAIDVIDFLTRIK